MTAVTLNMEKKSRSGRNLRFEQGANFIRNLTVKDENGTIIDLTTYADARMQIRATVKSATALADWSVSGGQITLDGSNEPNLIINVPASETAAITWSGDANGELWAVYDLELEDGSGNVTRLIEGAIQMSPEVTR